MSNNNEEVIVEILPGEVKDSQGEFTNDEGEKIAYHTRKQPSRLETGGFAYPYDVRLEKDQKAYPPGRYRMRVSAMLTVNKGMHYIQKYPVLEALTGK